jgi:hypothetical protein
MFQIGAIWTVLNAMFLFYFHMQYFIKSVGRVTKPMRHLFQTDISHMCHACEMWMSGIIPFWIASEWATDMVFMMSHESERDFSALTLLFSVAPLSDVQLENRGVMLPKFHLNSLLVTNPCFVGHFWVGLGPILSYRHV